MNEAPKKIYSPRRYEIDFIGQCGFWADRDSGNCTEYIRADLVDKMREALEAAYEWAAKYPLMGESTSEDRGAADLVYSLCAALEEMKDE